MSVKTNKKIYKYFAFLLLVAALNIHTPVANTQTIFREQLVVGASGLPIPRFVSLSANEANLRTGPNQQYPILWVFVRRGTPLEVTAEYGAWRRVRDVDGTVGWMHSALLSGTRTALFTGTLRTLFADPSINAATVLRAEAGVLGTIETCVSGWCKLNVHGREGWLPQEHFWGTYSNESFE
ncbi:MAG: SH3 domain-containing protein [Sphingomonadales bacterium]|nr:SH3 domain-containing protein [Sphingomonadales bacterium]